MEKRILRAALPVIFMALLSGALFARADLPPDGAATLHGVDIYHGTSENGQIDWQELTKSENFVYIKADEGEHTADPMFCANYLNAEARSMPWGPYHFLRLYSPESATLQADYFWSRIKGTGWTLTPAVDCESHDGQQTAAGMRDCIRAFVTEFKRVSGLTPTIYTSTSYANDYLRGAFADCPHWLADYRGFSGSVEGWKTWTAWQYSESGRIPAIVNGEVDLDAATVDIFKADPVPVKCSKYPYIMTVKRGSFSQRTVRVDATWSAKAVGIIRVGDKYEIMSPVDQNGWVIIGLCGKPIGHVSAACF